jgi:hypothetical protein
MRLALIAGALLVVLLIVFAPGVALVALAVVGLVLLASRRQYPSSRPVGIAWGAGGALLAAGSGQLAWREGLSGPFLWSAVLGGLLIAFGFLALPLLVRGRGALALAAGLLLAVLGVATVWLFVGFALLPIGLALYLGGALRAGLLPVRAAAAVAAALLAMPLALWAGGDSRLGAAVVLELVAATAAVAGLGVYVRTSAASRW